MSRFSRRFPLAVLAALALPAALADEPVRLYTNDDLPKTPRISIVGTLKVDEAAWGDRFAIPPAVAELSREARAAEEAAARAAAERAAREEEERRRQQGLSEDGIVLWPGYGGYWGAAGRPFGRACATGNCPTGRRQHVRLPQLGPVHMQDPLPPNFGWPGRTTRHLQRLDVQPGGVMPRFVAP